MDLSSKDLKSWIDSINEYTPASWDRLPELELYMDQVITFMNRQLEPFNTDGERLLTPSMINNYVKDEVLPRPEKKKYSRSHLAMLFMICTLKSVLSLPEISALLSGLTEGCDIHEQYPAFVKAHGDAMKEISERLNTAPEKDKDALYALALQLALEANARRIAAARILDSLAEPNDTDKDKPKKE